VTDVVIYFVLALTTVDVAIACPCPAYAVSCYSCSLRSAGIW